MSLPIGAHILGIDPGATGGLAELDDTGHVVQVLPMPMLGKEIDVDTLAGVVHGLPDGSRVIVESVHAFPKQGVSGVFRFGFSTGTIHGVVRGARVPLDTVHPQTWMKVGPGATGGDKAVTAAWAGRTFPGTQIVLPRCRKAHEGICDALGIAWWGHLKYGREVRT
jgi:crossover junction endodeoxyribonuclease RuvC